METQSLDKVEQARRWADYEMRNSSLWPKYLYANVLHASKGQIFVVWDYVKVLPKLVAVLRVAGVSLDFDKGLQLELCDILDSDESYFITQDIRQVFPGVFLWTSPFTSMRFVPEKYHDMRAPRHLNVAFCVRTHTHPIKSLTPGHRYISVYKDFVGRWPQFK